MERAIRYTPEDPLLMIPGPTPVSPGVAAALAAPVRGHATAEVARTLDRIRAGLRLVTGAPTADVYILPGSGTLAMETAVVNHVAPGERVIVVNHGYFGDRFAEICVAHGIEVTQLSAPWGQALDPAALARAVEHGGPPALVMVTHVDTSTGTMAPVGELAAIARAAGAMVLLDGVCATAGVPEELDAWGVDLLVTASQKALAVPPGLAVIVASAAARERRQGRPVVPGYYMDLSRWDAAMAGSAYFATHATTLLRGLEVSLEEILAEGLPGRYERHRRVAAHARAAFAGLGMSPLTEARSLAPTLSVLALPAGVDDTELRGRLLRSGVLVAGGIGPFAGRAIRVGHMGTVAESEVDLLVAAVGEALASR
ncbi:MAG: alanine--glyoxylate aminotransferase family protein [Candidatus Dormibacteria bacterium]